MSALLLLAEVPTRKGVGLGVAVWAKDSKVLQHAVEGVPVDMVQLEHEGFSVPFGANVTLVTLRSENAKAEQLHFQG